MTAPTTLLDAAHRVLSVGDPSAKTEAAALADRLLQANAPLGAPSDLLPETPARPDQPQLVPPGETPKRKLGSPEGRATLLHAIAHIEFNAINLAFDMAARFSAEIEGLGLNAIDFVKDWVRIGGEEARHFNMIEVRLVQLDCHYGTHPAHNGLWEAAVSTRHSALARLAIAPLILEARGLDVTPDMIERLRGVGDLESAGILEVIYTEEIGHVACGKRWFDAVCDAQGLEPAETFNKMKASFFAGQLKPPFNHDARQKAGLPISFYEPNRNQKGV